MFNDLEKPSALTSIADEEWNRTSRSWKELQPRVNFDEPLHSSNETVKEYHTRISQILEIPFEVVSEWLFIHYGNTQTVNNYGWIDYRKVDISVRAFSTEELLDLNVISDYKQYVEEVSCDSVDRITNPRIEARGYDEYRRNWKDKGTWLVPPVILDVSSLTGIPDHADLIPPFQLVEGHTRLGSLKSLHNKDFPISRSHRVYLITSNAKK